MKSLVLAILFLSLFVSSKVVAQTASSHFPSFVEIRYKNFDDNVQNNIPQTIKYDYRMHFYGNFLVSSLDNVGKLKVVIDRGNSGANPAFTGIEIEIFLLREGGKVLYQIEGVKREVKNNRIHYDACFVGDNVRFASTNGFVSLKIQLQVYDMNDNHISTFVDSRTSFNYVMRHTN